MKRHWSEILIELGACSDAVEWAKTQKSRADAWKNCKHGDWMMWILSKSNPPETYKVKFVKIACEIARSCLKHVPAGEDRPRLAIEAAEGWIACQDKKQRAAAVAAAWAAGDAARAAARAAAGAAGDAAVDAAWAAGDAARAAAVAAAWAAGDAAGDAAWAAGDAARAAAWAAGDAARAAARAAAWAAGDARAAAAKIVRKHFPKPPSIKKG